MSEPKPYWHLRGRARQIAKAKFVRYYEENRSSNPQLVFSDYCRKFHLEPPDLEVSFVGDKLLLRRGDRQHVLALDAPVNVARLIFQSLRKPSAPTATESTNNERNENDND